MTESQTAFNGNLKKYQLNFDENEIDLLDFMMRNKEVINDFICEDSQNGSIKVQFSVEVSLMKHLTVENDEEPNVEKTTLFLNTEMVRVNYGGLEQRQYIEMIEHMLNSINCFAASHGSGWIIERISKVNINFAKLSPMRAGSYLPLPLGLKKQNFNLVNIQTKTNDICFLFCFIAAYHLKHCPPLYASSQAYRKKTNCATYKEEDSENEDSDYDEVRGESDKDVVVVAVNDNQDEGNAEAPQRQPDASQREMKQKVKIQGDCEMPMSILEIGRFERLNNVQINVFR